MGLMLILVARMYQDHSLQIFNFQLKAINIEEDIITEVEIVIEITMALEEGDTLILGTHLIPTLVVQGSLVLEIIIGLEMLTLELL